MNKFADDDPGRAMSGIGGGSTGTAVAGAGLQVGPETTLGKILLLASPATSVVAGQLFFYLHVNVNRWLEDRQARRARSLLKQALDDPDVPDEVKREYRELLGGHYRDRITREMARVTAIGHIPDRSKTPDGGHD